VKELVSRCDVCDDTDGVVTYRITREGVDGLHEEFEIDLDQKQDARHKQALHVLLERHARTQLPRSGGGGSERSDRDLDRLSHRVRGIPHHNIERPKVMV
jgi:hypothetical protein